MRPARNSSSFRRFVEKIAPELTGPSAEEILAKRLANRADFIANLKKNGRHTVVLAGANGLLGTALQQALAADGHLVKAVSRRNGAHYPLAPDMLEYWQIAAEGGLPECDSIVQVTGANIMEQPLTEERLKEHYDSRVGITKLLGNRAKYLKTAPKVFIHASCVGMYPSDTEKVFTEAYDGEYADDFYGEMCHDMEQEALKVFGSSTRIVHVRLGHLLGPQGLLRQAFFLDPKNRWNVGYYGNGKQWFPWIHFADAADIFAKALLDERYSGVINAIAPGVIQQRDLGRTMRSVCHDRKAWFLPAPKFVANYLHTDRAFHVLQSRKVLPSKKLEEFDFEWRFPTIDLAIKDLWEDYKYYNILPMPETPPSLAP